MSAAGPETAAGVQRSHHRSAAVASMHASASPGSSCSREHLVSAVTVRQTWLLNALDEGMRLRQCWENCHQQSTVHVAALQALLHSQGLDVSASRGATCNCCLWFVQKIPATSEGRTTHHLCHGRHVDYTYAQVYVASQLTAMAAKILCECAKTPAITACALCRVRSWQCIAVITRPFEPIMNQDCHGTRVNIQVSAFVANVWR